jgi:hypothetical protein
MAENRSEIRDRRSLTPEETFELRRLWTLLLQANLRYRQSCRDVHLPLYILTLMGARLYRLAGAYKRRLIELNLVQVDTQPPYALRNLRPPPPSRQSVSQRGRE